MPEKNASGGAGTSAGGCVDQDGDGFGDNCTAGRDCNDLDPVTTNQCFGACSSPSQGCQCNDDAPLPCFLDQTANADGTIMCHEGTRHCRSGSWGACEDVHSFSVSPRQDTRLLPDVFPRPTCSDCEQNCFVAQDYLEPVDAGLLMPYANNQIEQIPAGGITVRRTSDAGVMIPDSGPGMYPDGAVMVWPIPDAGPCLVGVDPLDTDCDNIPNYYDPNPTVRTIPFDSPHPTIVATTPNNLAIDIDIDNFTFRLREADIYFMLDVTRNQNTERTSFINAVNNIGVTTALVDTVAGGGYSCLDVDADGNPDDFRKFEGLLGAARCFTGDTQFGVGFLDEVPVRDPCSLSYGGFLGYGATTFTECHYGDDTLRVPFRNLFDVNPSDAAFQSAVWRLPTVATRLEIPQAGTQALWALSSGGTGDLYYGPNRPAFGARRDCPAGTWGGACFRDGVLPITFMFTDTGQHNGPNNYIPTGYKPGINANTNPTYAGAPYVANNLALPTGAEWGTPHAGGERARHLPRSNETFFNPFELGAIDDRRLTFTGSTIGMTADASGASMGACGAQNAAPDAFVAFNLATASTVTISTTGTPYDSEGTSGVTPTNFARVVSLFPNVSGAATPITMMTTPLGNITGNVRQLTGDSSSMTFGNGYLGSVSHCGADGSTGEAHVTFSAPGRQIVGSFSGGGTQAVMDIYNGLPPGNPVPSAVVNNDTFATAHTVNGAGTDPGYVSFTGNTNNVAFASDLLASTVTCGAASNTANDAVYVFNVNGPRRVRIDTEGSAIDTVISLHDAPPITPNIIVVDNVQANSATGFNMGFADNTITFLDGNSFLADATFLAAVGPGCSAVADSSPDHLVRFDLSAPTVIRAHELGGGSEPPVAIYTNVMPSTGYSATDDSGFGTTGVSVSTAYDLNVPLGVSGIASRVVQLTGLTTTGKAENVTTDMFAGCGASPPLAGADDVVYKFRSPVAISNASFALEGAGAARPMMALFNGQPNEYLDIRAVANDTDASGYPVTVAPTGVQTFLGSTTAPKANQYSEFGALRAVQCNTAANAFDAVYRITTATPQSLFFRAESRTAGHDPVLRLFPQTAGVPAVPWANQTLTPVESGALSGPPPDMSGRIARVSGTFGAGAAAADDSTFDCAGIDNNSKDTFVPFRLSRPTTLWMHVNGAGDSDPAIMVFPKDGGMYSGPGHAKATNLATGTAVPCLGAVGTNDQNYNTITLAAGEYYAVIKAMRRGGSACAVCLCLCGGAAANYYQDDAFYLEMVDVSTGTFGTTNQAQLGCNDSGGSAVGNVDQLGPIALPAGTYDLVVTEQGATHGDHRLTFGAAGQTVSAPVACSSNPTTGPAVSATSGGIANTPANADANPLTVENSWIRKNGDFGAGGWGDESDGCGADSSTRDAFFRFTISRASRLWLQADGSNDTNVGVTIVNAPAGPYTLAGRPTDLSTAAQVACSSGGGARTLDVNLAAGTYYAIVKAHDDDGFFCPNCVQDDPFHLEIRDLTRQTFTTNIAANTDYFLVVKGQSAVAGTYNLTIGGAVAPTMCMAPNTPGTTALPMPAGTHYALLKGAMATGPYYLQLGEAGSALDNRIACDNDTGPGTSSMIEYNLPSAGDYYVVVKGAAAAQEGAYRLNIRDMTNITDNWVGCANQTTTTGFTTPVLGGGTYTAIIKGSNGTEGPFNATLYDQAAMGVASQCSNGATYTAALGAGRHIIGIKGSAVGPTGNGAYQVTVAAGTPPNATAAERAFVSKTWANSRNAVTAAGMKVVPMQSCEPGTDWGTGTGAPGPFNAVTNPTGTLNACGNIFGGPLVAVLWIIFVTLGWVPFVGCLVFNIVAIVLVLIGVVTSGGAATGPVNIINNPANGCNRVYNVANTPNQDADALYATVQNPTNYTPARGAWPQSKEIARNTGTVKSDGTPIAFWLRESPTSDTVALEITRALYQLSEELRMDVSMDMVWDSTTTPAYVTSITALNPTDCISAAGATHRDCAPGDQPEFQVQFLNPGIAPVAQNPDPGWNGGWPGRLVIYGDGQFVLDEIPVFLIPPLLSMVGPPIPPPRYSGAAAVYYQDIGTRECTGTLLPDWTDLFFSAEMPPGTQIDFRSCAANDPTDLATCTMQTVATVFATNTPCFSDAACRGMNGFCGSGGPDYPGGYCQVITPRKHKGLCSSEPECPDGPANGITPFDLLSDCVTGECEYDSQPADVGAALGSTNFLRWSRMQITLSPNTMPGAGYPPINTFAPNLLDWAVTYVCTPNQ